MWPSFHDPPRRLELTLPVNGRQALIEALVQTAGQDHWSFNDGMFLAFAQQNRHRHAITGLHPVLAPEIDGIDAEFAGHLVHVRLESKQGLRPAITTVGTGHRQIGIDYFAVEAPVGTVVAA